MRVVAGALRGRRIGAPDGLDTRPTGDRVRESVFNALGSLDAVDGARVIDLFAGSGALGIEALSRGAARCTFVERARPARDVIHANLRELGLVNRSEVVANDALAYLRGSPVFDLALADPPYEFDDWPTLLERLDAGTLVIESNRLIEMPSRWSTVREKRYGSTVVLIVRRVPGQARGVARRDGDELDSPHPPE